MTRKLIVIGCSATKIRSKTELPAVALYDGPMFRVLRSYLRSNVWPESISIAVLSAKHGLIGALSQISTYNRRMTPSRALDLQASVTMALTELTQEHGDIEFLVGREYLTSVDVDSLTEHARVRIEPGPIGEKLSRFSRLLRGSDSRKRDLVTLPERKKAPLYFLPDWDDFLDVDYNFSRDTFSSRRRSERNEAHSISLIRPHRISDGVLASLAQTHGAKGFFRKTGVLEPDSMTPPAVREHFKLQENQYAFGDCGAFSYVNEPEPTISVSAAVAMYDLAKFDFGASVDHIPVPEIETLNGPKRLSRNERKRRLRLTRTNASNFLEDHRRRSASFLPVGVIQGIEAADYFRQVPEYAEMGYQYVALGGLVPRTDTEIAEIVRGCMEATGHLTTRLAVHLFGVFRPELQDLFRRLRVYSFDSATYFRKAWLRSSQNYLGTNGRWYAAVRIPPSHDPRTLGRIKTTRIALRRIQDLERSALAAVRDFGRRRLSLSRCVDSVLEYDSLLKRADPDPSLAETYARTLDDRPWESCSCRMCQELGVHILIFRGLNRNKRRGAHNTLMLYRRVQGR